MFRPNLVTCVGAAACVVTALFLSGCGSEDAPVTAETTKFRPAGEGDDSGSAPAVPADRTPDVAKGEDPAPPPTSVPREGSDSPRPKTAKTAAAPAAGGAAAIEVPEGDIKTLSAFIDKLAEQAPQGETQQEMLADFHRIHDARLAAVKRILAQKPDEETKLAALNVAFQLFQFMREKEIPGARSRMEDFAKYLKGSEDPELARLGRFVIFNNDLQQLAANASDDGTEIVARAKQFVKEEQAGLAPESLEQVGNASDLLLSMGLTKDALTLLNFAADTAAASKDEKLAAEQHRYRDRAAFIELDANSLLIDVIGDEPDAEATLSTKLKETLAKVQPSAEVAAEVQKIALTLEATGHGAAALDALDQLRSLVEQSDDQEYVEAVLKSVAKAHQRAALVGQTPTIEGVDHEGKPFNWAAYQGKVVLVDFWATWCGPCMKELPNILNNFHDFHELGFEVVGVSMDTEIDKLTSFQMTQELPWKIVTSQDVIDGTADKEKWTTLPMAEKFGVEAIPFVMLVGKDGKVDSIHVQGPKLRSRLVALLGDPEDKPATEAPAADKPAEAKPADDKPVEDKPAEAKSGDRAAATPLGVLLAAALLAADEPAAAPPATADDPAINPYAAKPGLTNEQLTNYILKMLDKPKTIQHRPGFCEAMCEACDRLLAANPPPTEVEQFVAVEAKFETLHKKACMGDAEADKQLVAFLQKMKDDQRPRVARQVAFFQQERKVLDAIDGPAEKIPDLLKELQAYYDKEKLTARHLRMASSTVALINKLENGDDREKHFTEFGDAFAKASDKELARYGKKLAKKPAILESDLVGKPLALAGTTAAGAAFSWEAYRGKVVLVDFWATWCGPCRREMPNVIALREKLKDRGFEVVGVSLDEDQEALAAFLEENALPWETIAGEGTQDLADTYGVRGIPTMMLVDKEGKVAGVAHASAPLAALAEKLLSGSGTPAAPAPAR